MRAGKSIFVPNASGCMLTLPTTSRWPTNAHWGLRQRQTRPLALCVSSRIPDTGCSFPRSEPVKLAMLAGLWLVYDKIGDISAVLPPRQALVVMPPVVASAHAPGLPMKRLPPDAADKT